MKKAIKILIKWGFEEFPANKGALRSFRLNYCSFCKKGDAMVDFHEDDWFFFETPGMSGTDPVSDIKGLISDLRDYGILGSRKPKKIKS